MLVVSIVSHGHGEQALALLRQIGQASQMQPPLPMRVVLTLNLPEPELAAAGRRPGRLIWWCRPMPGRRALEPITTRPSPAMPSLSGPHKLLRPLARRPLSPCSTLTSPCLATPGPP